MKPTTPNLAPIQASPVIAHRWMLVAFGEAWVIEDTRPGKSNERIEGYHGITRAGRAIDDVAWCASYVGWCLEQAGVASTRNKSAASYRTWGQPVLDLFRRPDGSWFYPDDNWGPLFGAVAVFGKSDPDAKGTGHVAFILGASASLVYIWGGNQANRVGPAVRDKRLLEDVRWPNSVQLPGSIPPPRAA